MFQKGYFQHFRCFFGLQGAKDETISVELKSGIAEIFGNEMVLGTKYTFRSGAVCSLYILWMPDFDSRQNRSPALHEQGYSDDHVTQHSL